MLKQKKNGDKSNPFILGLVKILKTLFKSYERKIQKLFNVEKL